MTFAMEPKKQVAAASMFAFAMMPVSYAQTEPRPVLLVTPLEMPQTVPEEYLPDFSKKNTYDAVRLYHDLRKSFEISHTVMASWLGVKRRTLYNWMNQTSKTSKYGMQIESRLIELQKFIGDIEPEHIKLVNKIAFSPIYGDPDFGVSITEGDKAKVLLEWYDKLFSRFESYQSALRKSNNLG